jgi:tetratricopeptide (TPR) repeat protein
VSKSLNRFQAQTRQNKAPFSASEMDQMVALYTAAQWDQLIEMATDVTKRHPMNSFGWKALGKALLMSEKFPESLTPLARLTKIAPNDPDAHFDLASANHTLNRLSEAEAGYRRVLKINPLSSPAFDRLGALQTELGRFEEAEASFRRALELDPKFVQAYVNLAFAVDKLDRWQEAEAIYRSALELDPNFAEIYRRLGDLVLRIGGRNAEAIMCFERAIALNPADSSLFLALGNALMADKRFEESHAMFRRAQQIQPLITRPSRNLKGDFSVLLLDAPEAGCTPVGYLVGRSNYDSHFLVLLSDVDYDIDFLRSKADVIINMISDADNGRDILPFALDIADRINRPTINHPRVIMGTNRETTAKRLSSIALCRIPKTVRFSAADFSGDDWKIPLKEFTRPLLIRCAGTHGGNDFEKIESIDAIVPFVTRHPEENFYLSEFVDYSSADGYFRKYRLISIDNEIFPYHLAIHDHWMVHHFRTDMANQAWMREEEESFLKQPSRVFSEAHYVALRQVAASSGLNYCGIDCGLDRDGNIVVFEANATMRVHDEKNSTFAYKNFYIEKIKSAFDAMLARMA